MVQSSDAGGYATPDFIGVTDSAFTSVLVTTSDPGDNVLNINDVSYASGVTPEPGKWPPVALASFGLLAFAWQRNRRVQKQTA